MSILTQTDAQKAEFLAAGSGSGLATATALAATQTVATDAKGIAQAAQAGVANPTKAFATLALAQADAATAAGTAANVYNDSDATKNGRYINKTGAVGGYAIDTAFYSQVAGSGVVAAFATERVALSTPKARMIFDKTTAQPGMAISRLTGARSASTPVFTTGLVGVRPGDSLVSKFNSYYTSTVGMVYFDQARQPMLPGPTAALTAGTPVTVPAGAYYVEIPYLNSTVSDPALLKIYNADTLPAYDMDFGDPALFPWLMRAQAQAKALRPTRENLLRIEDNKPGLLGRNDGVVTANSTHSYSDYIPVTPGVPFKTWGARPQPVTNWGMTYSDKDKVVIPGVGLGGPFTDGQEFTPPANAAYVQICCRDQEFGNVRVLPSSATPLSPYYHKPAFLGDFRQWSGRKFVHLEDSFGFGANWQFDLYAYLGATMTLNASANSRRMENALKTVTDVPLTQADFAEVVGVYLKLGTNDYNLVTPLGSYSDGPDALTFYGFTRKNIETMLGWNKYLRISIGTIHQRLLGPAANPTIGAGTGPNSAGFTTRDYSAALRAVAQDYSCPIIDFERESGMNPVTIGTYTDDGLHPNIAGGGRTACLLNIAKAHFNRIHPTI